MKLIKTKINELCRNLTGGDLLTAHLEYDVQQARGELTYHGPKIPRELWYQIVSFLKWANDTAQSEAQVRLFVSTKHKTWKAWAFPQKGHGGLSSEEIQDEEFQKQRAALFEKDGDWTSWGTVHSHANIGAFQSGTDEADEVNQGGLHITVGNLGDKQYSFHARLYHQKDMYEPDMSVFWDIGDPFKDLPPEILLMLPEQSPDKLARIQMCVPVTVEFPEQWKTNYRQPAPIIQDKGKLDKPLLSDVEKWYQEQRLRNQSGNAMTQPFYLRLQNGFREALEACGQYGMSIEDVEELFDDMSEVIPLEIIDICKQYNITPEDLSNELNRRKLTGGDTLDNGAAGHADPLNQLD